MNHSDGKMDSFKGRKTYRAILLGLLILSFSPGLAQAHLDLLYPDGPLTLKAHQVVEIRWDVYIDHGPGTVKIELSTDNGADYSLIVDNLTHAGPADRYGSSVWVVPEIQSSECKIKVTYTATAGADYYNGLFPGENNPTFSILNLATVEVVLEQGVNGYSGTRDNTIYEENTNTNGGGSHLFAGNTRTSFARRALLAFDLSGIPQEVTILSASLQLTVSRTQPGSSEQTLHRLTKDWGEGAQVAPDPEGQGTAPAQGDATWVSNFHNLSNWSSPGADGDYVAVASATATAGALGSRTIWLHPQLAQNVQDWLDGVADNYGWIVIGDEVAAQTAKRYHSADSTTAVAGQRPRLVVRYLSPTSVSSNLWSAY